MNHIISHYIDNISLTTASMQSLSLSILGFLALSLFGQEAFAAPAVALTHETWVCTSGE